MENVNKQDETDLLVISRSIKGGVLSIFNSLSRLIDFSIKNIWALLFFVSVGIAVAIGLHFIKKPSYSYVMCLSHNRLDNDNCMLLVDGLSDLLNPSSQVMLSKKLNMSISLTQSINEIKYKTLNERVEKLFNDSTHMLLPFQIKVKVSDQSIIDTLQKGILSYLENNEYALKLKEIDNQNLKDLESKIKLDLSKLDSLKLTIDNSIEPRANGNGIVYGEPVNPVGVYIIDLEMYTKLMEVKKRQVLNNSFDVMMGFMPNPSDNSKGVVFYAFFGALFAYVLGLLVVSKMRKNANAN